MLWIIETIVGILIVGGVTVFPVAMIMSRNKDFDGKAFGFLGYLFVKWIRRIKNERTRDH